MSLAYEGEDAGWDAYNKLVEELQALCDEFECAPGEHRIHWLRERLTRLRELESKAR